MTIFSAHGVSRAVENDAKIAGLSVLDATCPSSPKSTARGNATSTRAEA